jgi:hypothetical protein
MWHDNQNFLNGVRTVSPMPCVNKKIAKAIRPKWRNDERPLNKSPMYHDCCYQRGALSDNVFRSERREACQCFRKERTTSSAESGFDVSLYHVRVTLAILLRGPFLDFTPSRRRKTRCGE